jgi:hypothetical protein
MGDGAEVADTPKGPGLRHLRFRVPYSPYYHIHSGIFPENWGQGLSACPPDCGEECTPRAWCLHGLRNVGSPQVRENCE